MSSKFLKLLFLLIILLFIKVNIKAQSAAFSTPDTVCVNTPVKIINQSAGGSSFYWNFDVADINTIPQAVNLGNPGGALSLPVFTDIVSDNGNYYVFVTNNWPGKLVRLNFGNSLLNTPVVNDLGNFGGVIPNSLEGVQVVNNNGKWYVIIVGGDPIGGSSPKIVKIDFGTNLGTLTPVITDWGNIGNLNYPVDLHIFEENNNWYGFTLNANNNTITRFNFGSDFNQKPTGLNLGNIGNLSYPTGIFAISDKGLWHVYITNGDDKSTITRLDFGSSLLNTPTAINLGNPNNALRRPRDIYIMKFCGQISGFIVNGAVGADDIVKLDFENDLLNIPKATTLGNLGNLNFPHSISKIFRVGADLYSFITNVRNNTMTRIRFAGSNNASIPNSTLKDPGVYSYSQPGVYNVNLMMDEGLPTQSSFCKSIVVLPSPKKTPTIDTAFCAGDSIDLKSNFSTGINLWNTGSNNNSITVKDPGVYWVQTTYYGCSGRDSFNVVKNNCIKTEANFTAPDTICVNTPVEIKNLSTGSTTSYWNFCVSSINGTPNATNLGNVGGLLKAPVFVDNVFQNGNYYGFVVNNDPGSLVRLDFGNSLLNTPTATDLGNFGGIIPRTAEGIQVVEANGKWQAIIVGGTPLSGATPRILKIDFGAFLNNPNPIATNWGNIGNMDQAIDLYLFKDKTIWYGFTVNSSNNSITRFNFGKDFSNPPTAVNLGSFGFLNYPTGIYTIADNGFWRVFVTNGGSNSITRLDFGASLLNNPIPVNLGVLSNTLSQPRDIYIMKFCSETVGFVVNGISNDLVKLNFSNGLDNIPQATSLGNVGNLNFPHSISQLFRVGSDIYSLIPNVNNNTLTRLQFKGCTDINVANSSDFNPLPIIYTKPGTYNINLMIDEGLSTQTSFCKTIVVLPPPKKTPTIDTAFCAGDSIDLKSNFSTGINLWNTGSNNNSITVKDPGVYWVEANNYGCIQRDSVIVLKNELPVVKIGKDTAICIGDSLKLDAGNVGSQFLWQDGSTQQTLIAKTTQIFSVRVTDLNRCTNKDSIKLIVNALPILQLTNDTTICSGKNIQLSAIGINIDAYNWAADPTLSNPSIFNPVASPQNSTKYFISVTEKMDVKTRDSVLVNVAELPIVKTIADSAICVGSSITLATTGSGSYTYQWNPATDLSNPSIQNPVASPLSNTQYTVTAKDRWGCTSNTSVNISLKSLPFLSAYGDTAVCSSASVQLLAVSPGNTTFNWTPNINLNNAGIANPIASPLQTTTYKVTVTGNNNCLANDSVLIQVFPKPLFSINPLISKICKGDSAVLTASGGDQYQWFPVETVLNSAAASTKIFPVNDTRYSVLITDNKCAVSEILEAIVTIQPKAEISITKTNDINCVLGQATLSASGAVKYQWEPAASLSSPLFSTTIASPAITTMYHVKATSSTGCVSKDSIQLIVQKGNNENNYLLPSAFTPNNDGINDCFGVKKWGYITNLEFSIFNRFGEKVFFTADASNCWDGRYKGVPQAAGAFVYIIKAKGICGDINRKGTFILIR